MNYSALGGLALALAVMCGAFGAHALRGRLDAYSMDVYQKAVFYHFVHAIGLLVVPLFVKFGNVEPGAVSRVCLLLIAGIVLFSGSLYVLALTGVKALGAVTPFGGVAFIAAWFYLAWAVMRAH